MRSQMVFHEPSYADKPDENENGEEEKQQIQRAQQPENDIARAGSSKMDCGLEFREKSLNREAIQSQKVQR